MMSVVKRSGFPLEGSGLLAQGPSAKGPLSLETRSQLNGLARRVLSKSNISGLVKEMNQEEEAKRRE